MMSSCDDPSAAAALAPVQPIGDRSAGARCMSRLVAPGLALLLLAGSAAAQNGSTPGSARAVSRPLRGVGVRLACTPATPTPTPPRASSGARSGAPAWTAGMAMTRITGLALGGQRAVAARRHRLRGARGHRRSRRRRQRDRQRAHARAVPPAPDRRARGGWRPTAATATTGSSRRAARARSRPRPNAAQPGDEIRVRPGHLLPDPRHAALGHRGRADPSARRRARRDARRRRSRATSRAATGATTAAASSACRSRRTTRLVCADSLHAALPPGQTSPRCRPTPTA